MSLAVRTGLEHQAGACNEVGDGTGDEDFTRARLLCDRDASIDGLAEHLIPLELDLAGVDAGSSVETGGANCVADGYGAADSSRGTVEGRQ